MNAHASKRFNQCRICGPSNLEPAFDLGPQHLANGFYKAGHPKPPMFPLHVLVCPKCGLAQLSHVVDPDVLYRNYCYVTSKSETMRRHFDWLSAKAIEVLGRKPESVLEIGSNDGAFLARWKANGCRVFGVDPAVNLAGKASDAGVPTLAMPFDERSAAHIAGRDDPPDLIIARHVFAHIDDWHQTMLALDMVAGPETLILIEVPDASKLIERGEFDTIYHEHLSYLDVSQMEYLLAVCGANGLKFKLVAEWRTELHGGSVVMGIRRGTQPMFKPAAGKSIEAWRGLSHFAAEKCEKITELFHEIPLMARFSGYGAPAKSTVMMNMVGPLDLDYITDTTKEKQGLLHPCGGIPIVRPEMLDIEPVQYAFLFAWNFQDEILARESARREAGLKFLVPLPNPRIV